ncbi:Brr1p TDEL_0C04890 [Torulaspora delbrueckii]|uniref:Pre-mRNA-splicing factor BRR1 n=1 Tax=Torulaspora delbrueckii TaxID=4950 RepID=G8ZS86_TORDE|nr:hypothetical protein TDEL_0C04890 [Torulaspora delbrueckii]CCE91378.1 hypothetical protein TDEL_0C04890 [Torulaspora delbrueckii]
MESQNGQSVDSVFGQTPAFALNDEQVDPAVVEYLNSVRQEALRTSAVKVSEVKRHAADIYDEDDIAVKRAKPSTKSLESIENLNSRMDDWLSWFENAKKTVLYDSPLPQRHTEESMNLLLNYLKQYLSGRAEEKGFVSHLLRVLKDLPEAEEDDAFELDEGWAESVVKRLRNKRIEGIEDITMIISNDDSTTPMGFKQWYQYMQQNEPSQAAFGQIINTKNIWVLIQYMTQEWIKIISKFKKPPQAIRFSNWLLYILFNVPENLTADYTSSLRSLGKKCQAIIRSDLESNTEGNVKRQALLLKNSLPSSLKDLGVRTPPGDLDVLLLSLYVIAIIYRQKDLINWNTTLQVSR